MTGILTNNPNYTINKYGKKTKLVMWTPIDYIPTADVVSNTLKADIVLTMNPIMVQELKKYSGNKSIDWVGHGSDIIDNSGDKGPVILDRQVLFDRLNEMRKRKLIVSKDPLNPNDIIILNANNYGPITTINGIVQGIRKRLDLTLRAFLKLRDERNLINERKGEIGKPIKLWIHTSLKSFFEMMDTEKLYLKDFADDIIMSNNTMSSEQLSLIYQACRISVQTSTGEGWSLTNMEASLYRSLQVVPEFLACGFHYSYGRGLLIPISFEKEVNESGKEVIVGLVSIDDTTNKLKEAIELVEGDSSELNNILDKAYEYSSGYTWESIAESFMGALVNYSRRF
jgi:hypothetical protein